MNKIFLHFKKIDLILLLTTILLFLMGLLSIYSSSRANFLNFEKQALFFVIGFFLMIIVSFFDWRHLKNDSLLVLSLYLISLILLVGLFFFAPSIHGAKSWYKLGPISLDPTEFIKIILIILLAKYFSVRHVEMYQIRHILISGFYVFLPAALIFSQPDLGSTLILLCLWVGILIISGIKLRHFLILVLFFLLVSIFSWNFLLKDYQKDRILSLFYPIEPLGVSWSQNQSKIAIGSGGVFGQGISRGSQTQLGFLPEPQTDFIFAAIAEEMGLVGVAILLILFSILIWRIIKIALSAETNFPRLFSLGLAILLISQIFINIGMNLGILPIIGIPLPLISYGGSSLIITLLALGILQSIKVHP